MARLLFLPLLAMSLFLSLQARASDDLRWADRLGEIAVQDGGRVMPLDAYARRLAVQLTGRQHWSASGGPEAFAARSSMQLLCDLMYGGQAMLGKQLIAVENRPFKTRVGLDTTRRFFSALEISGNRGINDLLEEFRAARQNDPQAQATRDQRRAMDLFDAANRIASLVGGEPLAIVPGEPGKAFLHAGPTTGDAGTQAVTAGLAALGKAYTGGGDLDAAVANLRGAIDAAGKLDAHTARAVSLETFYDRHAPWRKAAVLYALAVVLFAASRLVFRRALVVLAVVAVAGGVIEHLMGVGLRVVILGRAPVSNTYEALLWMGLVAITVGVIAQLMNRRGFYLFGATAAALISVLFAGLVPLGDQTNSLPAVLRSNYWLTLHVLTIVASYGVLAVASVLGHVYLGREVLFARRGRIEADAKRSAPLIVQTYRTIQAGLFLLTAGTILGGVWAADSWGRFWGWDPKETWALISIVVYFAVLHARYIRWLRDFGLAAASVLGFVVIVWTFYGVNYVMATGLHSYGFGSGGEVWVGLWAVLEIAFLVACRVRYVLGRRAAARPAAAPSEVPPASARPAAQ